MTVKRKTEFIVTAGSILIILCVATWGIITDGDNRILILALFSLLGGIILFQQFLGWRQLKFLNRMQKEEDEIQRRLARIVNTMPVLYMYQEMITDENGVIVDTIYREVNNHFTEMLLDRKDCIGKHGSELFADSMPIFMHASNEAKRTGKSVNFQYFYPDKNVYFDIMARPSEEGRFMEYFMIDSTNLYHLQKRMFNLNNKMGIALEVSRVLPWRWELDTHMVYLHRTGRNEANEITHREEVFHEENLFLAIHRDDRERIRQFFEEMKSGSKTLMKEEFRIIKPDDGKMEWMEMTAIVSSKNSGKTPLTLVGSIQIITHRKMMENELIKAKQHAEESDKLKSAFLANMSHEIRTPLNAIVGFSSLMVSTDDTENKHKYSQVIETNSELLLQLIGDILDLSKIEAGTLEFKYSDFDLNKLLTEIESSLQLRMRPDKPVALILQPGLQQCIIKSERNRLTQVITNFVTNAIKFTERGSITIAYQLQGDMLRFSVTDTGCGIAADKIGNIFERFVKLNSFKTGTGLGLPICKSIVESLGGEIGVSSEPGKGSTFWFTIPYVPASIVIRRDSAVRKNDDQTSNKDTILIAEDNESNYELIEAILSQKYNLVHAWNGREAVEMFSECNPKLILMDINMPEMDGYEATREIRKITDEVPILALTAYAYATDEERILNSGMNSYMSKPIDSRLLKVRVADLLHLDPAH